MSTKLDALRSKLGNKQASLGAGENRPVQIRWGAVKGAIVLEFGQRIDRLVLTPAQAREAITMLQKTIDAEAAQ